MQISPTAAAPAPATTTPAAPVSRAPGPFTVPTLQDASATAMASMRQVAAVLPEVKEAAGTGNPEYFLRTNLLADAIGYAKYARALLQYDGNAQNDGFLAMIDNGVLAPLGAVAKFDPTVAVTERSDTFRELDFAASAARSVAEGLALLAGATHLG